MTVLKGQILPPETGFQCSFVNAAGNYSEVDWHKLPREFRQAICEQLMTGKVAYFTIEENGEQMIDMRLNSMQLFKQW